MRLSVALTSGSSTRIHLLIYNCIIILAGWGANVIVALSSMSPENSLSLHRTPFSVDETVAVSEHCLYLNASTPYIRYPRQYVAHVLQPFSTIIIDGNLEDAAWSEVPWTEDFVDITHVDSSDNIPPPPRYDNRCFITFTN